MAPLALAISCSAAPEEDPLTMHVTWGVTRTSVLPGDVTDIDVVTCVNAGQSDESCSSFTCSVNALSMRTENEVPNCRPWTGTEMYGTDPVLVRSGLETGVPLRFRLLARNASGAVAYVGQVGPLVLGQGERRFVELHMYELDRAMVIEGTTVPRFLHTASLLPDGRVLIAGGFTSAARLPSCPESLALPAEARCFDLVATDQAVAFDPSSARVEPIRAPMLAARAGHTATTLPDGRVLIAGGAERAVLAMIPYGTDGADGYAIAFYPRNADGTEGAHASYELFDAYLDREEDPERDGDLGAGRFLGIAGQSTSPGSLNQPRFLHAAAAVPARPDLVVLAGGLGGPESAGTFEVFDNRRAGGYGVYLAEGNVLPTAREMPSAIGVQDRVWIFGGALAADNAGLADVWTLDDADPNGSVAAASDATQFPNAMTDAGEQHPEYALFRPAVARVGSDGSRALVVGWYGPQCEPGVDPPTPRFVTGGATTEYCNAPSTMTTRSFTVAPSGITIPTTARPRAFAAVAELGCFRPEGIERWIAMTGGVANRSMSPQTAIDVFTGGIDNASGAAQRSSSINVSLATPRAFHTSTGIPGLGIVTAGGVTFGGAQVVFQATIEVTFLQSPDFGEC